ncbi:hypothetical protein [Nocardia sp. NPDC004604]|uniref:hypothetical protein n=1 Tax=Nocardia sp. NPDC004604 TaxID=3157013 RepID=UPI0033A36A3E
MGTLDLLDNPPASIELLGGESANATPRKSMRRLCTPAAANPRSAPETHYIAAYRADRTDQHERSEDQRAEIISPDWARQLCALMPIM